MIVESDTFRRKFTVGVRASRVSLDEMSDLSGMASTVSRSFLCGRFEQHFVAKAAHFGGG